MRNEFKCRKEHGFDVNWLERWDLEKLGLNAVAAIESQTAAVMDPYRLKLTITFDGINNGS